MPSNPLVPMELDGRDRAIVQLVARFKQASSAHIHALLFSDTSRTPCDRALRRLTERGYLARIERRIVGGAKGGSGQYVYQLGRRGFFMHFTGRYQPVRTVSFHALAILESFIALRQAEQAGKIQIVGFSTEPDCWTTISGIELHPDMYLEAALPGDQRLKLWLEVDMGSESQRQLKGKLEAYWRAYNDADANQWPVFPRTLWIAVDDERAKELRWLIEQGPQAARVLFDVTTLAKLPELF